MNMDALNRIDNILEVDHIGYAVKDINKAKELLSSLGFHFSDNSIDEYRRVVVSMGNMGDVKIELLSPIGKEKSPIDGYLSKVGSTPYHICYHVKNLDETILRLGKVGFTQVGCPARSVPLGGNVCFLFSMEIGLIELIEY